MGELTERVLKQVAEAFDSEIQAKIQAWKETKSDITELKEVLKQLGDRLNVQETELIPIIGATESAMARVDNAIVEFNVRTKTGVGYKEAFETALTKVNAQTKAVLEQLLEETKQLFVYPELRIQTSQEKIPAAEATQKQVHETLRGIWNAIKNAVLGGLQRLAQTVDDGAAELEAAVLGEGGE